MAKLEQTRVIAAVTVNRVLDADGEIHVIVYADDCEGGDLDRTTALGMLVIAEKVILCGGDIVEAGDQ